MSSHTMAALESVVSAFRKSAGIGCTTPSANFMLMSILCITNEGRRALSGEIQSVTNRFESVL